MFTLDRLREGETARRIWWAGKRGGVYFVGCGLVIPSWNGPYHKGSGWVPCHTGNNGRLPREWGRELTNSVCIVLLHQHGFCRACPLCWVTDLYKCTVMATAWQAWKEDGQWARRRHAQRGRMHSLRGFAAQRCHVPRPSAECMWQCWNHAWAE